MLSLFLSVQVFFLPVQAEPIDIEGDQILYQISGVVFCGTFLFPITYFFFLIELT